MRTGARAIGLGLLVVCALVGFASALGIASAAGADTGPEQVPTTEPPATSTEPPPTEPPPTETEPPPPSPRQPAIAAGVTIGGLLVGGLAPSEASVLVRQRFARPLVVRVADSRTLRIAPAALGARPDVEKAVTRARFARPDARIPLDVAVRTMRVRRYMERLGRDLDRVPVDARLVLVKASIRAIPAVEGRRVLRLVGARAIRLALKTNVRAPIELPFRALKPKVSERDLGPAVVILRESKRLRFFVDGGLTRTFRIATGQSAFPTPLGSFEIVTLQRNPWWYPPPSDWAAGERPVPPGPGNPLGTRWMGISAPYVGIHGTPDAASIGYSASHGCVRMRIPDAEWLFGRVEIGTPVFIVRR